MKSKKLNHKDRQLLAYNRQKQELQRELDRMEELRQLSGRAYYPKELKKIKEIKKQIAIITAEQMQLFLEIKLSKSKTRILHRRYVQIAAACLALGLASLPMCFHMLIPEPIPKVVEDDPLIQKTKPKRQEIPIYPLPKKQISYVSEAKLIPAAVKLTQLAPEFNLVNLRDSLSNELRIRENENQLIIWNRTKPNTNVTFELLDGNKTLLYQKSFKYLNSVRIHKKSYSSTSSYYYQVYREDEVPLLLYFGKL